MSLGSDIVTELDIDCQVRYMEVRNEAMRGFWTTRDGSQVHVSDMTESHIRNTIRYIERVDKVDLYLPWIDRFKSELRERGLDG